MEKELISIRLKQLPVRLHLKNKEFAELLDISQQLLIRYQSGETMPPASLLVKCKTLFNVDMNWLCDVKLKDCVATNQIICKYK